MFILSQVPSSGRHFSITVQPILKNFTGLEAVIQGLHFFLCNLLDIFAPLSLYSVRSSFVIIREHAVSTCSQRSADRYQIGFTLIRGLLSHGRLTEVLLDRSPWLIACGISEAFDYSSTHILQC